MGIDPDRIETVTFDSYGTLVDVESVERALADRVADPTAVSRLWRFRSLTYAMVSNAIDRYRPFDELLANSLSFALAVHDEDLSDAERAAILDTYHDLDPFDDVRAAVESLSGAGYDVYVLSNGTPDMLDSMVEGTGIGQALDGVVSADAIGRFKPDVELYRYAAARTGTPVDRICHVSALFFDVQGGMHAGNAGAWVDRGGGPVEPFGADPDLVAADLHDVVDALT